MLQESELLDKRLKRDSLYLYLVGDVNEMTFEPILQISPLVPVLSSSSFLVFVKYSKIFYIENLDHK